MKPVEMLWRKTAARNRFQMRQCALWWKETGERHFIHAAINARDDAREALRLAAHYSLIERMKSDIERFKAGFTAARKERAA